MDSKVVIRALTPAERAADRPMMFRATIELNGINPYVLVDAERARRLKTGWRRPMPVLVQVNGRPDPPWRINMMPKGDGGFYLYLHGDVREASGTKIGDSAIISLSFDATYRGGPAHTMPQSFAEGLDGDPGARAGWNALPPSRKKEILRYFDSLKSERARTRNVERALRVLGGAPEQFMGRDWNAPAGKVNSPPA